MIPRTATAGRRSQSKGKRPKLARHSGIDMIFLFPRPGQQFVETVHGMPVNHPLQHVPQVGVRFDFIELAALDERAGDGPSMTAAVTASEEMILSSKSNRPDCPFNRVGVELDATIIQEARQILPARKRVANVLIWRSNFTLFYAGFCDSAGAERLPNTFRCAPVDAFDQHRELCRCQRNRAVVARHRWPDKPTLVDSLRKKTESVAVPKHDLQHRCFATAEGEQMTRECVLLKHLLDEHCEAIEAFSHVGIANCQMYLH